MGKHRRPTLSDVAAKVGVTKMTVSRYLNKPEKVAAETGVLIQAALDELGYIPNRVPDMLSHRASMTIGVILPTLNHPVFEQIIAGIHHVLEESGYQTLVVHSDYDENIEQRRVEMLLSYNVDGLIFTEGTHTEKTKSMLEVSKIPYIEVLHGDGINPFNIGIDNVQAAENMVALMFQRGYQNIVCLSAKKGISSAMKVEGYLNALAKTGGKPRSLSAKTTSSVSLGRIMTRKVLERYPDTDAFFCSDDELAAGVLIECQALGLSVPEEIGIAGIHALDIGQSMMPKLASVITPDRETGERAALGLLSQINGTEWHSESLAFEIDEGESLATS